MNGFKEGRGRKGEREGGRNGRGGRVNGRVKGRQEVKGREGI